MALLFQKMHFLRCFPMDYNSYSYALRCVFLCGKERGGVILTTHHTIIIYLFITARCETTISLIHPDEIVGVVASALSLADKLLFGLLPFASFCSFVSDLDLAVRLHCIDSGTLLHATLEAVVETCHFIPFTKIPVEVNSLDNSVVHCYRCTARVDGISGNRQQDDDEHNGVSASATLSILAKPRLWSATCSSLSIFSMA